VTETFNPTEWITTKEAAELTGYTMARFRQLAKAETVEAQKRGRDWFLKKASVQEWADRMKQLGTAKHDPTRKWKAESN
jgi:excisionase family DNA binding protein